MQHLHFFTIFFLLSCKQPTNNIIPENRIAMKQDSTVFIKRDSLGRVIERWGNENKKDNNGNFRYFYFYDNAGNLVREKNYFFEDSNTACKIVDTADYDEVFYRYIIEGNEYKKAEEIKYSPQFDSVGKIIGRMLFYRYDILNNKEYVYSQ
jgi:hypothetical protein